MALLQEQLQSALTFAQPAQAAGTTTTIASGDTLSGSVNISVGGGAAASVSVGAGGTPATLAGLATAINNANLGVTASVITSGTSGTLSLINSTSGSSGAITVDSSGLTDSTTGTQVAFGVSQSNAVTSITQLGISVNNDGTLTLNSDTLDSILNSNYQDVVNFLQPSGAYTSFGGNLTNALNNLGNSAPDGAIYLALQQDSQQETSLNTNITNENQQISTEQANLTTELNGQLRAAGRFHRNSMRSTKSTPRSPATTKTRRRARRAHGRTKETRQATHELSAAVAGGIERDRIDHRAL